MSSIVFLTADAQPAKLLLAQTMCFCQRSHLHWLEGCGSWGAVSHQYQCCIILTTCKRLVGTGSDD